MFWLTTFFKKDFIFCRTQHLSPCNLSELYQNLTLKGTQVTNNSPRTERKQKCILHMGTEDIYLHIRRISIFMTMFYVNLFQILIKKTTNRPLNVYNCRFLNNHLSVIAMLEVLERGQKRRSNVEQLNISMPGLSPVIRIVVYASKNLIR